MAAAAHFTINSNGCKDATDCNRQRSRSSMEFTLSQHSIRDDAVRGTSALSSRPIGSRGTLAVCSLAWLLVMSATSSLWAAVVQSNNFVVTAPTPEFARQVAEAAEHYREQLAIEWTGRAMPDWFHKCPVRVDVGNYGASGETTFNFENGEVFGWRMIVRGTAERILDSVLPHEVNHTIFATHFRRPLPRWADEGAASVIEHSGERLRLQNISTDVLRDGRKIPLRKLLEMRDYPKDTRQILTLYAEGYTLAHYLLQLQDRPTYLRFLQLAHEQGWDTAFAQCYRIDDLAGFERIWDRWVLAGCPELSPRDSILADARDSATSSARNGNPSGASVRGQSATADPAETARNNSASRSRELPLAEPADRDASDSRGLVAFASSDNPPARLPVDDEASVLRRSAPGSAGRPAAAPDRPRTSPAAAERPKESFGGRMASIFGGRRKSEPTDAERADPRWIRGQDPGDELAAELDPFDRLNRQIPANSQRQSESGNRSTAGREPSGGTVTRSRAEIEYPVYVERDERSSPPRREQPAFK